MSKKIKTPNEIYQSTRNQQDRLMEMARKALHKARVALDEAEARMAKVKGERNTIMQAAWQTYLKDSTVNVVATVIHPKQKGVTAETAPVEAPVEKTEVPA